ncbi:MAG: TonB-dependent receptor [Novosphingobium sp.]
MNYRYLSILLATTATPAFAEDASDVATRDDIVVTASHVSLTAREIGSSVTVVTATELRQGQITFVKEALQDLPGIQISSDRPGDLTSVSIRGSDNDQVLFLIDGLKLGDPSSTSTQFQSDHLTSRDIARIEVLRGNQSSLYGSDAIGGVINIITQRATEDGFKVNAEGEYGSYNTLNGGASILGKTGPVDFRVTATGYRHQGPSLADPATANGPAGENDAYWRYGFSGRVGVAAGANVDLQLISFWQDSFSDLDNTRSDNFNTVRKREWSYAGQGSYKSDDGKLRVEAIAGRYVARRLYFGTANRPQGDLYKGTKDSASLNANYDSGGLFSVAVGGNWEREKTDQVTNFSGDFRREVTTKAGYAELALKPIAGLTLTGAARIDDNSRFGTFDTYRATAAYVIDDAIAGGSIKLRASFGTGAKAPGLYQLFDPTYGNPNLKVETSKGGDVGVDMTFGDAFTAQVSYFFARTRNEIVFDGSIPPFGGYAQFGKTRKSGIEVGFQLKPTDWLSISQSYTYLKAEQDKLENNVWSDMGRPKHSGSTAVTVRPVEHLSVTARARYRGRNASSASGITKAYATVDLLGSYQLTGNVELYARIVNLFDKQYQASFGKNALDRSAYGGVRISF